MNWSLNGSSPAGPGNDSLEVYAYDGIDTVLLATYDGPYDTTWNLASIPLLGLVDTDQPLQFMFYTQDLESGNQDAVEAAIDGFRVVEAATLSNETLAEELNIQIFPNPFTDQIEIKFPISSHLLNEEMRLDLYNLSGQLIKSILINYHQPKIQIDTDIPSGLYFGFIKTREHIIYSQKLIKKGKN